VIRHPALPAWSFLHWHRCSTCTVVVY
jgi:hypothetical protein